MSNWWALDDILNTAFSLISSVSNNPLSRKFTRVCFWTQEIRKDIEIALKPTGFYQ